MALASRESVSGVQTGAVREVAASEFLWITADRRFMPTSFSQETLKEKISDNPNLM